MPSSRGYSQPRDRTWVSKFGRQILYHWATRDAERRDDNKERVKHLKPLKNGRFMWMFLTFVDHLKHRFFFFKWVSHN